MSTFEQLLLLIIISCSSFHTVLNLSVFEEDDRRINADGFTFISGENTHHRFRRDVRQDNVTMKVNNLTASHQQLIVHWVGEGSNIIICLARDSKEIPRLKSRQPSTVYYSYDYGDTFVNKSELLQPNGTSLQLDKFYIHPKDSSRTVFVDSTNRMIYVTEDDGKTFSSYRVDFIPNDISFHPTLSRVFLAHEKANGTGNLYVTRNFGRNWELFQMYVKSFDWFSEDGSPDKDLIVQRHEPDGLNGIVKFTLDWNWMPRTVNGIIGGQPLFVHAVDMYIKGDFMFVTMNASRNVTNATQDSQDFYVKYRGGQFLKATFFEGLANKDFHVADITDNRILVAVGHSSTLCNLYVSNIVNEKTQKVDFALSLERIFCYFPNITWRESLINGMSDTTYADLHKVEGLRGIYIASQILPSLGNSSQISLEHLSTKITFNWGVKWNDLTLTHQLPGKVCKQENCSLHLTQKFASWFPTARYMPILSSKSAPGLIIATGVADKTMKGHPGVYMSRDAGATWRQVLDDSYYYNMGDHGGIIVAIKFYKSRETVTNILYSTDEGETWKNSKIASDPLTVYSLMTEPGENTTIFSLFGSASGVHKWVIVKADFRGAFNHTCTDNEFKEWWPIKPDGRTNCVMGRKEIYERRIARSNCYVGVNYDRPVRVDICECDKNDFMCDEGFYWDDATDSCVRNKTYPINPYVVPDVCQPYSTYLRTKGYKKIPGNVCVNGISSYFTPDVVPCPIRDRKEFLLLAQKERIVTFRLSGDMNNTKQDVLPISGLQNVIAVEYDMRNECLYYADIVSDVISKWCLSSGAAPVRIVDSHLNSVEGMAYDWISKHLYFVDGVRSRIEIIRTDIDYGHRYRKTIINNTTAKKPRGIAVHPVKGYMFWTDWATMSINRANLDGTNELKLFAKPIVEWPNGITVDFISDRIYWVDAREDYIASADLNGNGFKKILERHPKVSHPFSVAVYKDDMYWDDWRTNAIYLADKDNVTFIHTVASSLPGLMDLKIYAHSIQEGTNACTNNTKCSHLCFGLPDNKYACHCPDDLQLVDGTRCVCPGNREPMKYGICPSVSNTCGSNYFRCKNGDCIPITSKCDGDNDCADGSDELCNVTLTCPPTFFRCGNGKCIPEYWKCDYDFDCSDRSDEHNCSYPSCKPGQFKCDNGRCIAMKWYCDGENDCRDGSDEIKCSSVATPAAPTSCRGDEFNCGGNLCISRRWLCDNERDCQDGSDEANCTKNVCDASYLFQCANHKCILQTWRCDGEMDCADGSDEENCTDTKTSSVYPTPLPPVNSSTCSTWMFLCNNSKCVPYWWKCDHINDCGDNSDELGCLYDENGSTTNASSTSTPTSRVPSPINCSANEFRCNQGECIRDKWVCDGMNDCAEGEDEKNCETTRKCKEDEFQCHRSGMCIMSFNRCDGVLQCPDGSDEDDCSTRNSTSPPSWTSCAAGYFTCDASTCLPLHKKCDGSINCYDESDESNCTNSSEIYQVVDLKTSAVSSDSFRLMWHVLPIPLPTNQFTYIPSIYENKVWKNYSEVNVTHYKFENLTASRTYNVTVYVKHGEKIFPSAFYAKVKTMVGKSDRPRNVTCKIVGDFIEVRWSPPVHQNGDILSYTVAYTPPLPPQMQRVDANKETVVNIRYQPSTTYTIWVLAFNGLLDSDDSEKKYILTPASSRKDVSELNVTAVDKYSVSLSWKTSLKNPRFSINCRVIESHYYPLVQQNVTNSTTTTVLGLSPGEKYTCEVSPTNVTNSENIVVFTTGGSPFPQVSNIRSIPGKLTKLTWNAVKDLSKQWQYAVYYGVQLTSLLEAPKAIVNGTEYSATGLASCTKYVFNVGVVWQGSYGSWLRENLAMVTSAMDLKAAPKGLKVNLYSAISLKIKWRSSCSLTSDAVGYEITIHEMNSDKRYPISIPKSNEYSFTHIYNGTYGCHYNISIKTTEKDAISSDWVTIGTAQLPIPYQVVAQHVPDKGVVVRWDVDKSDGALMNVPHSYEILVNEGRRTHPNDKVKPYTADKSPTYLTNLKEDTMFTVAVRTVTSDGHKSDFSEDYTFQTVKFSSSLPEIAEESGNVWRIVLILLVLGSVVGFVYWKRKRSHMNFKNLANSHYNTRSGSATFSGVNGLDMEDTPEIRETFSDDEPLVVA